MPKCLECGFEAPRLQWTHFKFKCNGKFNNGTEYKDAHPGAKLVDDKLAKSTAVTLTNLIKKYGEIDGNLRWESYKLKQANTNTFRYKQEKYGWTKEEFNSYNKSRATTLENLINRYGEELGTIKWIEYCNRQAYTNTKEYFISKYGIEEGSAIYQDIAFKKGHSLKSVMQRHSCSINEAKTIVLNYKSVLNYSSNAELKFINALEELVGKEIDYSTKTKQYCIWANNKANFYDIVHNNRAIEFNGDYWHCNPKTYKRNFYHKHSEMIAEEIWAKDDAKIKSLLTERKIETLVVWESEFNNTPDKILEKCKQWLIQKDK